MRKIFFLLILLIVPLAILAFVYFWLKHQQGSKNFSLDRPDIDFKDLKSNSENLVLDPKLEQRLMQMLSGDEAAARRLIESEKVRHPGRSENWYWEKVIYNLERDRHF